MSSNILVFNLGTTEEAKFLKQLWKTQWQLKRIKSVHKRSLKERARDVKLNELWPPQQSSFWCLSLKGHTMVIPGKLLKERPCLDAFNDIFFDIFGWFLVMREKKSLVLHNMIGNVKQGMKLKQGLSRRKVDRYRLILLYQ